MLGKDLVVLLRDAGHDVTAIDKDEADITDARAAAEAPAGHDVVVNCAAWTAVDDAETHEGPAFMVNAVGAANLARGARLTGARMVQISTDYVFAGDASTPYPADGAPSPRSAYGRTKAAGEWGVRAEAPDHLVVRTAWLYGAEGPCFPRTMARLAADRDRVTVVDDQVGQPTWTWDVADLVHRLVTGAVPSGTYHATSQGQASWFEFARAAVAAAGIDEQVIQPTTSADFVRPAPRPSYSVLSHDSLLAAGIEPIGDWRERWSLAAPGVLAGPTVRA
jgi:dTDP-4-dehydrorhamnose reductase